MSLQTRASAARSEEMLSQTVGGGSEERATNAALLLPQCREGGKVAVALFSRAKAAKREGRGDTLQLSAINDHFKKIVL